MPPGDERRPSPYARKKVLTAAVNRYREQQARRLKAAYTMERQVYEAQRDGKQSHYRPAAKYDGGYRPGDFDNPVGTVLDNTWLSHVQRLLALNLDPVDYIRRVFAGLVGTGGSPPPPQLLLGERAMDLHRRGQVADAKETWISLEVQQELARRQIAERALAYGLTTAEATVDVLLDEDLNLSYLFRYCLAASVTTPAIRRLAKRFIVGAALQYIRNRDHYQQYWRQWIPAKFDRWAAWFYEKLLA